MAKLERKEILAAERRIHPSAPGQGALRVHLVYPNNYELGMSSLGFQSIFKLLNRSNSATVERAFAPLTLEPNQSWVTLEQGRPVGECDVLAFSLSFEEDYLNVMQCLLGARLLERGLGARLAAAERAQFHYPLLIAGGPAVTLNPEPLAEFFDLIFIGEAEEFIPEFFSALADGSADNDGRIELLRRVAKLEGAYVPGFFSARYSSTGLLAETRPNELFPECPQPRRRYVKDLDREPACSVWVTPRTEFSSMYLTEASRGCYGGCRFCAAGWAYRPVRRRSAESLQADIDQALNTTKRLGFVGASVSAHSDIAKLLSYASTKGAQSSISSVMSQKLSSELAAELARGEVKSLALAPETGREALRYRIGKRVSDTEIIEAARLLGEAGIVKLKLYFMLGLPTEELADVTAIADLALAVYDRLALGAKRLKRRPELVLSVNPFIPKAWTPFQWQGMLGEVELKARLELLRKAALKIPGARVNSESPREAAFQALLSRGDRRVGDLLEECARAGQDWKWLLKRAKEGKGAIGSLFELAVERTLNFESCLPWDHIDLQLDRELLKREFGAAIHLEKELEVQESE